ncbi:hypothetical protein KR215_004990 [Drosophila sulfurigaster]|nr:hypothetical protein KR215_004990 [Drosophila sulfurigaster]
MQLSRRGKEDLHDCGAPCHAMFFPERERTVLRYWVGSWAAVCVASCLFTVLTFLIDSSRFRYPERAIVFLAVCYLVVGCAYVAGLGAGDSVSCREPFPPPVKLGRLQMMSTITQQEDNKRIPNNKSLRMPPPPHHDRLFGIHLGLHLGHHHGHHGHHPPPPPPHHHHHHHHGPPPPPHYDHHPHHHHHGPPPPPPHHFDHHYDHHHHHGPPHHHHHHHC